MKSRNHCNSVEAHVLEIGGSYYRELLHLVDVYQFGDCVGMPRGMALVDTDKYGSPVSTCGIPSWRAITATSLKKAKEIAQRQIAEALDEYQVRCARTAILELSESRYAITEAVDALKNKARGFDSIVSNINSIGFDTSGSTHDDCVQLISTLATSGVDELFHEKLKVIDKHIEEIKAKVESFSAFFKLRTSDLSKEAEHVISCAANAGQLASMHTDAGIKDLKWLIRSVVREMEREKHTPAKSHQESDVADCWTYAEMDDDWR